MIASIRGDESPELLDSIQKLAEAADLDHESEKLASNTVALTQPKHLPPCVSSSIEDFSCDKIPLNLLASENRIKNQAKIFWLDPLALNEQSLPPHDIVPYLGQGSTRFASLILWSCMNHGLQRCDLAHSPPLEVISRSLQHSSVSQEISPTFVVDMIEARVQYIHHRRLSTRLTVAGEADLGDVINGRIRREYRGRGEDIDGTWLACEAVESCVRDMVGRKVFDLLEKGAAGDAGELVNRLMEEFKCRLWERCVCFGNGPRWHVDVVQGLVKILLEKALKGRS